MIRDQAAMTCARAILGQFVERGLLSETGLQLAASIIQGHVRADEIMQEIEQAERNLGGEAA